MRGFALPLSSFREMRFRMRILLEWLQLRLVVQTAHAQRDTGTAGDSLTSKKLPLCLVKLTERQRSLFMWTCWRRELLHVGDGK